MGKCMMDNINNPKASFFEDEVREGFFISSMMKRYWAAQIKVLGQIAEVCKRHNIQWFADYGTLLGAVRHGGFIPWDDDLDICMLRQDYDRFFAVAKQEFPDGYQILNVKTEPEYELMLGRIVNTNMINYGKGHLEEYFGCPYSIGIDIFPLDGLAEDEKAEEERRELLRRLADKVNRAKNREEKRDLLLLTDQLYAKYSSESADYVALMPFWVNERNHRFPARLFRETVEIPFEYIRIPVPAGYEELLGLEYGSFMKISKKGGLHPYPVYREQEEMLKNKLGRNPYRFTMPKEIRREEKRAYLREHFQELFTAIRLGQDQIRKLYGAGDVISAMKMIEGCQSLAISMGTILEEKIQGSEQTVHLLEAYCELLYKISMSYDPVEDGKTLNEQIQSIEEQVNHLLDDRQREILFLVCKVDWWPMMEPQWKQSIEDSNNHVTVTTIPYGIRNLQGFVETIYNDKDLLPAYVPVTGIEEYDIAGIHPDVIYIQNPYDEEGVLTIPESLCSEKLKTYTDELILLPCYDLAEPDADGDKISMALSVLIEQPAVYHADGVMVSSDRLRNLYVNTLSGITGEENRDYWEEKIKVQEPEHAKEKPERHHELFPSKWTVGREDTKFVVFQVNTSFLYRYKKEGIRKIEDSFEIMKSNKDRITCIFSPEESVEGWISSHNDEIGWNELIFKLQNEESIIYDREHLIDNCIAGADAYYGGAGRLAHLCTEHRIPVMLMAMTDQ